MHVERDAAGGVAVDRDVKALHRRVPALLVHRRGEAHAEELAVQVQDRLAHATVFEIGTHFLRVEVEALRLHAVQVVLPLPVPDGRRAGMIDALLLEEDGELGLRGVARGVVELGEEALERPGREHHAVLDVVPRPVRIAEIERES